MVLGELIVKIGANAKELFGALDETVTKLGETEEAVQSVADRMEQIGGPLTALSGTIIGIGGAAFASASKVGSFADEIFDLADQTGLSTTVLQEFRRVATVAGVGPDTLAQATIKLTTALSGAGEESKALEGAFAAIGVSARDAQGNLLPMDALLPNIITGLQGVEDTTTRNAIAADIFGRSWAELAPILSLSAEEFQGARAEAHELGLVIGTEALESADAFRLSIATLGERAGALTNHIGLLVIKVLELPDPILAGVGAIVGIGVAIGPVLLAGSALIKSWATITAAAPALSAAIAAVGGATGIGAILIAIGALVAAGTLIVQNWDDIKAFGKKAWDGTVKIVDGAIKKIADVFDWFMDSPVGQLIRSIGDLGSEVGRLFGILADKAIEQVQEMAAGVIEWTVDRLAPIGGWIKGRVIDPVVGFFGGLGSAVLRIVENMVTGIFDFMVGRFTKIVDGVKGQIDRVTNFFKGLSDELVGHSIVTDMVTEIGVQFDRMGGLMEAGSADAVDRSVLAFSGIEGSMSGVLERETRTIEDLIGDLGIKMPQGIQSALDKVSGVWGKIKSVLEVPLVTTLESSVEKWISFAKNVVDIVKLIWNEVGDLISKIGDFFKGLLGGGQQFAFGTGPTGGGGGGSGFPDIAPGTPTGISASDDLLIDLLEGSRAYWTIAKRQGEELLAAVGLIGRDVGLAAVTLAALETNVLLVVSVVNANLEATRAAAQAMHDQAVLQAQGNEILTQIAASSLETAANTRATTEAVRALRVSVAPGPSANAAQTSGSSINPETTLSQNADVAWVFRGGDLI